MSADGPTALLIHGLPVIFSGRTGWFFWFIVFDVGVGCTMGVWILLLQRRIVTKRPGEPSA